MIVLRIGPLLVTVACASCAPPATEGGFDAPVPASKMYAIEYAARDGDRSAIKHIVEQLESDDPAVRMLAISALHRLTGQTLGYRHYDPPEVRAAAVERWVQAVASGQLSVANIDNDDARAYPPRAQDTPAMQDADHG